MKMLVGCFGVIAIACSFSVDADTQQPLLATVHSFEQEVILHANFQYLVYLPQDYGEPSNQEWPLVLYLHGGGARGDDLDKVRKIGIPKLIEEGRTFPFVVVAPQLPTNDHWPADMLHALLIDVIKKHRIDKRRVYLTGQSRGGFGTWELGASYPDLFAAVVPISGRGIHSVCRLKDVPVWIFHGERDNTVPVEASQSMTKRLKRCGGNVQLTPK